MFDEIIKLLEGLVNESGIAAFFQSGGWKNLIMIAVAFVLLYLAIFRDFEPYLLIPIGFGMLLTNFPGLTDIFTKTEVLDPTTEKEQVYMSIQGC